MIDIYASNTELCRSFAFLLGLGFSSIVFAILSGR